MLKLRYPDNADHTITPEKPGLGGFNEDLIQMFLHFNLDHEPRQYNGGVILRWKTLASRFSLTPCETPENTKNAPRRKPLERTRRAGVLFVVSGMLLLAISAGDVLAGAASQAERVGSLPGSGGGETIPGTGGADIIHGLSGGDRIFGGEAADEIYGGPGRDVMLGGPGDDFVEAKDGSGDFVACGAGNDVVSVDEKDFVSRDCEVVYRA